MPAKTNRRLGEEGSVRDKDRGRSGYAEGERQREREKEKEKERAREKEIVHSFYILDIGEYIYIG